MTKKIFIFSLATSMLSCTTHAQPVWLLDVIQAGVSKVIRAVDLKIQRMQTQTIWLQDAEKALENAMSETELDQIAAWAQNEEALYQEYYTELWQVKQVISSYDKAEQIFTLQTKILNEYNLDYGLFKQDKHFSVAELDWMASVYAGILSASLKNVEQALLALGSFVTQMSDGARMQLIDQASTGIEKNYNDLKAFNAENIQLSLQRAAELGDVGSVKQLYGLQ